MLKIDLDRLISFNTFKKMLEYNDLNDIHESLFYKIINNKDKFISFQMHSNAYKTSLLILCIIFLLCFTKKKILIVRKNDYMAKLMFREIIKKIETNDFKIFLNLIDFEGYISNSNSLIKIFNKDKEPDILAVGLKTNITGLHFDYIFLDDIVTDTDRYSTKEREYTKEKFLELKNLLKIDGKIVLCGTPWHKDDVFSLIENILKYDIYSTKIFTNEKIVELKKTIPNVLFACNYELRHINDNECYFSNINISAINFEDKNNRVFMHIDPAFSGNDFTAITLCYIKNNTFYVKGFCKKQNAFDLINFFISLIKEYNVAKVFVESNSDQGAIARELKKIDEINIISYKETRNKHLKILTIIKKNIDKITIDANSDIEYIEQVVNYSDFAANDDAPDSLASLLQKINQSKSSGVFFYGNV